MVQTGSPETVFTYGAPQLKFGAGSSDEIGFDLSTYGVRRVLVVTDPGVAATGHPQRVTDQIASGGIEAVLFDRAHVEPTDASMVEAVEFARERGPWDAFVAVGGGSAIDTAKAVNLLMHATRRPDRLRERPGRAGRAPGTRSAAGGGADHDRHRQREHHGVRARRARAAGEERDQPPAAASDARRRRPAC